MPGVISSENRQRRLREEKLRLTLSNASTPEEVSKVMANQSLHLRTAVDNGFLSKTLFSVTFWPVSPRSDFQRDKFHDSYDGDDRTSSQGWGGAAIDEQQRLHHVFARRRKNKAGVEDAGLEVESASEVVFHVSLLIDPGGQTSTDNREGSQEEDSYSTSDHTSKYTFQPS